MFWHRTTSGCAISNERRRIEIETRSSPLFFYFFFLPPFNFSFFSARRNARVSVPRFRVISREYSRRKRTTPISSSPLFKQGTRFESEYRTLLPRRFGISARVPRLRFRRIAFIVSVEKEAAAVKGQSTVEERFAKHEIRCRLIFEISLAYVIPYDTRSVVTPTRNKLYKSFVYS